MARTSDLRAFLSALGLEQHAAAFETHQIDLDTLRTLTDADLRALGLTAMGPRKKLLAAIGALVVGPAATASASALGAEGGAPPSATPEV